MQGFGLQSLKLPVHLDTSNITKFPTQVSSINLPPSTFQYVNPAYEQAFGYSSEELHGKDVREVTRSDRNKADHTDVMDAQVRKGKVRDGLRA